MKKIILASILAFIIVGCQSNSSSSRGATTQPVEPEKEVVYVEVPAEVPMEEASGTPDVGSGSLNYDPSCASGFAYVVYVYQSDSTIDNNSFIILHSADGKRQDIMSGSVFGNGSISRMEADVYIAANNTDSQIAHQVEVQYISDGVSQSQSFSFIQPTCDEPEDINTSMTISL